LLDTIKKNLTLNVNVKIKIAFWTLIIFISIYILNSGINIIPFIGAVPQVRGVISVLQILALILLILVAICLKYPHRPDCDDCNAECSIK